MIKKLKFKILDLFRASYFVLRIYHRGFSLVEMIFYVVILSFSLVAITETLIVVTRSFGYLRAAENIEREGGLSLERIIREIRDAKSVDASSALGSHPGKLVLNSTNASGNTETVEFYVSNGQLYLTENGTVTGALTSDKTSLGSLVFRKITTPRSEGVKVEMTLSSGSGRTLRSEHFYATAVLRDSY